VPPGRYNGEACENFLYVFESAVLTLEQLSLDLTGSGTPSLRRSYRTTSKSQDRWLRREEKTNSDGP